MDSTVNLLDLNELKLPIYDDTGEGEWATKWQEVSIQLDESDGFVAVSPEWNGMASMGWFNMLHYVGNEVAHKPVMFVGVSSGLGGAYPIAQMKAMGQKNKHFVVVPEHLRVAQVKEMLNDDSMDEKAPDYSVKMRADYALKMLLEYAKALQLVRSSDVIDFKTFGNGV